MQRRSQLLRLRQHLGMFGRQRVVRPLTRLQRAQRRARFGGTRQDLVQRRAVPPRQLVIDAQPFLDLRQTPWLGVQRRQIAPHRGRGFLDLRLDAGKLVPRRLQAWDRHR